MIHVEGAVSSDSQWERWFARRPKGSGSAGIRLAQQEQKSTSREESLQGLQQTLQVQITAVIILLSLALELKAVIVSTFCP